MTCVPPHSQTNNACGLSGASCGVCGAGASCDQGVCAFTDGGAPRIGDGCASDFQCKPPQNGFCIPETVFGQNSGFPGGYCSASCGATMCPVGSTCIDVGSQTGGSNPLCFETCNSPRTGRASCRANYVCEINFNGGGGGLCAPRCNSPGFSCPQGTACNSTSGYCNPAGLP